MKITIDVADDYDLLGIIRSGGGLPENIFRVTSEPPLLTRDELHFVLTAARGAINADPLMQPYRVKYNSYTDEFPTSLKTRSLIRNFIAPNDEVAARRASATQQTQGIGRVTLEKLEGSTWTPISSGVSEWREQQPVPESLAVR